MKSLKFAALGSALGLAAFSGSAVAASSSDQTVGAPVANIDVATQQDTDTFELSTGFDYSIGKYGAAVDTSVKDVPIEAKAQLGRIRLQASLPYVWIKGPGQIVGGVVVGSTNPTAVAERHGIGDLSLGAAFRLTNESGALPMIELGGSVKVPTADTTIGTGETDYGANVALYKSFGPKVIVFGSVGYSWLGSPAAYQLKNGVTAYGGLNLRPDPALNLGASVSYRQPVATGLQGQAVVSPYLTYRFSQHLGFTAYATAGLNDASPRVGAGVRLTLFQ
jgi:hypothetical protein